MTWDYWRYSKTTSTITLRGDALREKKRAAEKSRKAQARLESRSGMRIFLRSDLKKIMSINKLDKQDLFLEILLNLHNLPISSKIDFSLLQYIFN